MTKNMNKVVVVFCLLAMMLVPCQAVLASEAYIDYSVSPRMIYIADYWLAFDIDGTTAEVEAEVNGDYLTATKAKVIAELQVKNGSSWIPVAIWTDEQDGHDAWVDETHDVVEGHTYRVKGTFMVWEGNAYETEYSYTDEITA